MGQLLLLTLSVYITGSLCDLLLHNSSYIYSAYCADTNTKNYTSWMWDKAACESEWDGKNESYIGEMSLELLSNMEHNYIPTNHSIINKERINNVFDKLSHGLSVHVIVFGGSFTAGRQAGGINNAWPDQLQRLWDASTDIVHTTKGKLAISNYAVGATTSTWLLYRLSSLLHNTTSVDLVIIDYDVNDCVEYSDVNHEKTEELNSVTEVIIRRILAMPSKPAVMYLNVAINHRNGHQLSPNCIEDLTCYTMDYSRYNLLNTYFVPLVSQKYAIWSNFVCPAPRKHWECGRTCAHPNAVAHYTVAKIFHYYFSKSLNNSYSDSKMTTHEPGMLSYVSKYSQELDKDVCNSDVLTVDHLNSPEILYNYTHNLSSPVKNISIGGDNNMRCWDYKEDVIGKPGWIVDHEGCINSSIVFAVNFGSIRSFSVTILTTYNNTAGIVDVYLSQSLPNPHDVSTEDVSYTKLTILTSYYAHPDNAKGFSFSTVYTFRSASWKARNDNKHHLLEFHIVDDHLISSNSTPSLAHSHSSLLTFSSCRARRFYYSGTTSCMVVPATITLTNDERFIQKRFGFS